MNIRKLLVCACSLVTMLCLAICLAACSSEITVTIDDNGTTKQVTTESGKTVSEVLAMANVTVSSSDIVEPALDSKVTESTKTITIKRCVNVTIVIDGTSNSVKLAEGTVQSALDGLSIVLEDGDQIDVALDAPLTEGMVINIIHAPEPAPEPEPEPQPAVNESKNNGSSGGSSEKKSSGRTVERKVKVPNCADGSHGYYEIYYSDGTVDYQEY